ncbi:MAG: SPOR domain-containing protein [Micrococcus sp.]|nr:SPOR domain-containing protein [Micrococcus sp.]
MTETEFWYNVRTGEVERGAQSDWSQLLGPYGSEAEARSAMDRVRANNEAHDAEDAEDAKWDNNPGNDPD